MATGLALPPGVDSTGHAKLVSGPDQVDKLLQVHIGPGDSTNPFESIGMPDLTFRLERDARRRATAKVREIFQSFTDLKRAKLRGEPELRSATPAVLGEDPRAGILQISYTCLESPTPKVPRDLSVPVLLPGGA